MHMLEKIDYGQLNEISLNSSNNSVFISDIPRMSHILTTLCHT